MNLIFCQTSFEFRNGKKIAPNFENFRDFLFLEKELDKFGSDLGLSDKPVQERGVGEEAVLILGVGHLGEKGLGILLGDGVTYSG